MHRSWRIAGAFLLLLVVVGGAILVADRLRRAETGLVPAPSATELPATALSATQPPSSPSAAAPPPDPFGLVSQEGLLDSIAQLTAIQPYSGWRNSASRGEAEALDYVADRLARFEHLRDAGLEVERQTFGVFLATELWETRLTVTLGGRDVEVPAAGLRGPRDGVEQALRFDSDGSLNDSARDPVRVEGAAVWLRSADEILALVEGALRGQVAFLDYALVDRVTQRSQPGPSALAARLLAAEPTGLVLVTRFSNEPGESHGAFAADSSVLNTVEGAILPPTLLVRLEDLSAAGIDGWEETHRIERAGVTWDADVSSPGASSNLAARIPGRDPSRAVILGAHIDSPNVPGALDDGSGSAILLEVARVLDAARIQPPVDLILAWFGSEELGLYGSAHFAATHQDLLDRTVGMLQVDCLTRPLDGITAELSLMAWTYPPLGDGWQSWAEHLAWTAGRRGVRVLVQEVPFPYSDNSSFDAYGVPNADLIYGDEEAMEATGSLHYAAHLHDPYDTLDLAREMAPVLEQMAQVALAAALEPPPVASALGGAPRPDRRALFIASHTEPVHMAPGTWSGLGRVLAWERFDVDLIPYGQAVTAADLRGVDLVFALPAVDYGSDPGDEAWQPEEVAALQEYVAGGGLLVLSNSAHRLKVGNGTFDPNEDWGGANALSQPLSVTFYAGKLPGDQANAGGTHPLMEGVMALKLAENNSVPFHLDGTAHAQVLAEVGGQPAVALIRHRQGEVLALADLGVLRSEAGGLDNLRFWQNLARYARR